MSPTSEIISMNKVFWDSYKDLSYFDEIFFLGEHTHEFAKRSRNIAKGLDNFTGVLCRNLSLEKRTRIADQLALDGFWRFMELDKIIDRARKVRVLVVDFNDTLAGFCFSDYLRAQGVEVVDYLKCMHDLDLVHTYETVRKERSIVVESVDDYVQLADSMRDELSKQTILARVKSFVMLDRRYLIKFAQPYGLFTSNNTSSNALSVGSNEIFADVGAAHGDTVTHFYGAVGGIYREIHAFEPDPINYNALNSLCEVLPRSKAYQIGISDCNSMFDFYSDASNRFGSRFTDLCSPPDKSQKVKCMKLDDILDYVTLIKIDVEGFESKVLNGAARLIQKCHPSLHISGYHYPRDLIDICAKVKEFYSYGNIAVRHTGGNLWDTNLLFSDSQLFSDKP